MMANVNRCDVKVFRSKGPQTADGQLRKWIIPCFDTPFYPYLIWCGLTSVILQKLGAVCLMALSNLTISSMYSVFIVSKHIILARNSLRSFELSYYKLRRKTQPAGCWYQNWSHTESWVHPLQLRMESQKLPCSKKASFWLNIKFIKYHSSSIRSCGVKYCTCVLPGLTTIANLKKTWTKHLDGKNQISHRNTPWLLNYLSLKQAIWIAGACQRRNLLRRTNGWRKGFCALLGQEEDFRGDFCCIARWISGHWHTLDSLLCVVWDWTESYRMCRIWYLHSFDFWAQWIWGLYKRGTIKLISRKSGFDCWQCLCWGSRNHRRSNPKYP